MARFRDDRQPAHLVDKWRRAVYRRDHGNCRMPECTMKGYNAHHIVPWSEDFSLRFEVSNGITLCYNHHKEVTGCEHAYVKVFKEIVDGKTKPPRLRRRKRH